MKTPTILLVLLSSCAVAFATLPPEAVLPKERFQVGWEGENWTKVSDKSDRMVRVIEYVRKGDRLKNWKELITDQAVVMRVADAKTAVEAHFQGLGRKLDGFESKIVSETPKEVLYEWWHSDPRGYGPEHVVGVAVWKPYSVTFFSYAKKGPVLSDKERELWLKRVAEAKCR